MTKTPEELAEEYANSITRESARFIRQDVSFAFFSGYQAAKDQLLEETGFRLKLFKDDDDAKAAYQEALEEDDLDKAYHQGLKDGEPQWISVKQQMPDVHEEVLVNIVYPIERIEKLAYRFEGEKAEWFVLSDPQGYFWNEEWITHWMPLPKPPEE